MITTSPNTMFSFLSATTILLLLMGCGGSDSTAPATGLPSSVPPVRYAKIPIDTDANGPAFVKVADVNGDGRMDMVVSKFGVVSGPTLPHGEVTVYEQGATPQVWTKKPVFTPEDGIYWPNDVELHDLDWDGDLDIVVGVGFLVCAFLPEVGPCGGLLWYEQTNVGWTRHDIVPPNSEYFYHKGVVVDLDGDGIKDVLTVAEKRDESDDAFAVWFKGSFEEGRFDPTPLVIGPGMGSIPSAVDVDQDGDLDIVSAEFFANLDASFAWYEQIDAPNPSAPAGTWLRHVIDAAHGPSIQFSLIPNFSGDDEWVGVGSNHTNPGAVPTDAEPGIFLYAVPSDPSGPWEGTRISENIVSVIGNSAAPQAAPGIFGWNDIEGDGDMDLVVSGDGDPRVLLLEQVGHRNFTTWVLDEGIGQAGGMKIHDLDGDGWKEIVVTGYEDNAIYVYAPAKDGAHPLRKAHPDFMPEGNPSDPGGVAFNIQYEGSKQGDIIVAVFETYPPTGPPIAYENFGVVKPPARVVLSNAVTTGSFQALIYLDSEPYDAQENGPEDPFAVVELSVPTAADVDVVLQATNAGRSDSTGGITPAEDQTSPGSLTIEIDYEGVEVGDVIVGVFEALPPTGPPEPFSVISAADFPLTVEFPEVPAGTHQVLTFLDLPPASPTFPGEEDPIASSEPLNISGAPAKVFLTLELP